MAIPTLLPRLFWVVHRGHARMSCRRTWYGLGLGIEIQGAHNISIYTPCKPQQIHWGKQRSRWSEAVRRRADKCLLLLLQVPMALWQSEPQIWTHEPSTSTSVRTSQQKSANIMKFPRKRRGSSGEPLPTGCCKATSTGWTSKWLRTSIWMQLRVKDLPHTVVNEDNLKSSTVCCPASASQMHSTLKQHHCAAELYSSEMMNQDDSNMPCFWHVFWPDARIVW